MKNPNREVMSNLPPFLLMQPRPQGLTLGSPVIFRAEKRSAQASAHPLSQAQGGLFLCVDSLC